MLSLGRAPAAFVLAATVSLAAAGCSGGDSSTPATVPSTSTSADGRPLGICSLLSADELTEIVGGALTASPEPGGGCSFAQDSDAALPGLTVDETVSDDAGGLAGLQNGLESTYPDGTSTDLDLGDGAVVVVGRPAGGSVAGTGLILLGDTLVRADLTQGSGYGAPEVTALLTDVLTLVATEGR